MTHLFRICFVATLFWSVPNARATEVQVQGKQFVIPEGFRLQVAAGPPLVKRPICADFDERGRLYVAESSGSNDPVQRQLEQRPHQILRLEDSDGDGVFDRKTVFADKMMFPEGTLWHSGALYVSAPPTIWKLTDTDDDGVADQREQWLTQTLTGCANDLHGPYLGRDGWLYWCKGAFAEQVHELTNGKQLRTRAAHIFRRHPDGGPVDAVMTGGMDNPVEVVFTPGGERLFSTTFVQHPQGGKRDALVHAVYGGRYGKVHGVLEDHPSTGDFLPPMTHLGAAAPCGLAYLESDRLGAAFQHSVVVTQFNRQRVTRHKLVPAGATFTTQDHALVVCSDRNFHPTDVLEDADGSLLIVDTGGWYKLCCPTSHLWKPDVLGAIYRLQPGDLPQADDPRGGELDWSAVSAASLTERLGDPRPCVVRRAVARLAGSGESAIEPLRQTLAKQTNPRVRRDCLWALIRIGGRQALAPLAQALGDKDATVRQVALHGLALHRGQEARVAIEACLQDESAACRRVAAEALGRLQDPASVPRILNAAGQCRDDRFLQHSLTYALWEIGHADPLRTGLTSKFSGARVAAMWALNELPDNPFTSDTLVGLLDDPDPHVRSAAWRIVDNRPDAQQPLARLVGNLLRNPQHALPEQLTAARCRRAGRDPKLHASFSQCLQGRFGPERQKLVLNGLGAFGLDHVPEDWVATLDQMLASSGVDAQPNVEPQEVLAAMDRIAREFKDHPARFPQPWRVSLRQVVQQPKFSGEVRLRALELTRSPGSALTDPQFEFLLQQVLGSMISASRARGIQILHQASLSEEQLATLAGATKDLGLIDLRELLPVFSTTGRRIRHALYRSLMANPSAGGLSPKELDAYLPDDPTKDMLAWSDTVQRSQRGARDRLVRVAKMVPEADSRKGQELYYSKRAACSNCHALGYLGGRLGPDLSRIGQLRNSYDLLESVLLPSQSFVRSYEPVVVAMQDGRTFQGIVKDETRAHVVLALDADKSVTLPVDQIEARQSGTVSVMPAGLAQQWTDVELADLIRFLQEAR